MGVRDALGRFKNGHPGEKPKGVKHKKRRLDALNVFDEFDFNPLEKKIKLAKQLESRLHGNHFSDPYEKIAYIGKYADVLQDLLQYGYSRLKTVEHTGIIEVVQKLQDIDTCTDEELHALLAEAEELVSHAGH